MKILLCIKHIIFNRITLFLLFGLLFGLTAIIPNIWQQPQVLCLYFGYIIMNVILQEFDRDISEHELQNKIDKLQKQIDDLKQCKTE